MEILRVLSSPDIDVRKKALDIALEMVSSKNVEEVVLLLKKELSKTVDQEYEKNAEYRQLLIHSIHQCAIKFSGVAASVVDLLMDFIADFNNTSAVDVINFVKEVVEKFPDLQAADHSEAGRHPQRGAGWEDLPRHSLDCRRVFAGEPPLPHSCWTPSPWQCRGPCVGHQYRGWTERAGFHGEIIQDSLISASCAECRRCPER